MIRIYTYGAFAPTTNVALLEDQLKKGHAYFNKLVELKHAFKKDESEDKKKTFKEQGHVARANCGAYWGTYLDAERRAERAKHFARYDGTGAVAVQIQKPITDLTTDARVQLTPWPTDRPVRRGGDPTRGPQSKPHRPLMEVKLRIGSEGRAPIWAIFPIRLHRPLPENGRIRWVHARRSREGTKLKWEIAFTVEVPTPPLRGESRSVGVDLGWRRLADGRLRVAYCHDDQGKSWDLCLSKRDVEALDWIERFQGGRDANLNNHRGALVAFILATATDPRDKTAPHWKSADRFARAVARLSSEHTPPEEVTAWLAQDRHLCDATAGARGNLLTRRNQQFHTWASELARGYDIIKMEKFDLRTFAKVRTDDGDAATNIRHLRNLAAPGILRNMILATVEREGSQVGEVDASNTTRDCADCGQTNIWPDQSPLFLTCGGCAAVFDQDHNAARNLASAKVLPPKEKPQRGGFSKRQTKMREGARKDEVKATKPKVG